MRSQTRRGKKTAAVPPPQKASDEEVIAYIKTHPGAIGYVSAATATAMSR